MTLAQILNRERLAVAKRDKAWQRVRLFCMAQNTQRRIEYWIRRNRIPRHHIRLLERIETELRRRERERMPEADAALLYAQRVAERVAKLSARKVSLVLERARQDAEEIKRAARLAMSREAAALTRQPFGKSLTKRLERTNRILEAVNGEGCTVYDLSTRLPDVPRATIYRMVAEMCDGGILRRDGMKLVNNARERA